MRDKDHSLKNTGIILITPNQDLRNGSQRFHEQGPVLLRHRLILGHDIVQIPEESEIKRVSGLEKRDTYFNWSSEWGLRGLLLNPNQPFLLLNILLQRIDEPGVSF